MIEQMIAGFGAALTPYNMVFVALGLITGIIFGVTPGLSSITGLTIMIPISFYLSPVTAIAFLVGITKGGTSGGAIPAILINAPGSSEAVATTRDGYPLAQKGYPVKAMRMALYSSVFGDSLSDVVLILLAAPMALIALQFGPAEITSLIILAFTMIAALSGQSLLKGLIATALGVFLATLGLDPVDGTARMTFGVVDLYDGISLNSIAIGTLALSSVVSQLLDVWRDPKGGGQSFPKYDKTKQGITYKEFRACFRTLFRSAYLGTFIGMLPGLGVTLAGFLGYAAAKRASKNPEEFGKGKLEGIAASEAANSAVCGANLIPTIALGIPGNLAAALLIGAFMIHGITPGPFMMQNSGDLVYALFASMLMANVVHAVIGRYGSPIWVQVLRAPKGIILPAVIILCVVGVYIPSSSTFEIGLLFLFTAVGYVMRKLSYSLVSFFMGFLLGPMLEHSLRQTLMLYGNVTILFTSPVALPFMLINIFLIWRIGIQGKKKKSLP
jgi:putative tricarboxylic transport membrane protein